MPNLLALRSSIIAEYTGTRFQTTDESRFPLSIGVLSPITSMNQTLPPLVDLLVSTACNMPKLAPSPWPKITSAPAPITDSVTRRPPAASEYAAGPMTA